MSSPQIDSVVKDAGEVHDNLPIPVTENSAAAARVTKYGEFLSNNTLPESVQEAMEGSYFTAVNPTPGTGIATIAAQATLVDTAPFILVKNNWSVTDPQRKKIGLRFLRLVCTAPGTAGASIRIATKRDVQSANRYTSGGSVITPVCAGGDPSMLTNAQIYAGAILAAAAPSSVLVDHALIRPVIPVIGDTYLVQFGVNEGAHIGALIPSGTAIADRAIPMAPLVIGPQQWAAIHIWLPSQSAASSYEFMLGYVEK